MVRCVVGWRADQDSAFPSARIGWLCTLTQFTTQQATWSSYLVIQIHETHETDSHVKQKVLIFHDFSCFVCFLSQSASLPLSWGGHKSCHTLHQEGRLASPWRSLNHREGPLQASLNRQLLPLVHVVAAGRVHGRLHLVTRAKIGTCWHRMTELSSSIDGIDCLKMFEPSTSIHYNQYNPRQEQVRRCCSWKMSEGTLLFFFICMQNIAEYCRIMHEQLSGVAPLRC